MPTAVCQTRNTWGFNNGLFVLGRRRIHGQETNSAPDRPYQCRNPWRGCEGTRQGHAHF